MKTLVIMTHSFRINSRLTQTLSGDLAFVYFSPWYYSDKHKAVYSDMSNENYDMHLATIEFFKSSLAEKGFELTIYKTGTPSTTIHALDQQHQFDKIIIDQEAFYYDPQLYMADFSDQTKFYSVDSDLIDVHCHYKTAKHRWMDHTKKLSTWKPLKWSSSILNPIALSDVLTPVASYSKPKKALTHRIITDTLTRAIDVAKNYGNTRDRWDGQTGLSTFFNWGIIDPHNVFFSIADLLVKLGHTVTENQGLAAQMLRQFAFRENTIREARLHRIQLGDEADALANKLLDPKSLENYKTYKNPDATLTWEALATGTTGHPLCDKMIDLTKTTGRMPNRSRMWFAGWVYYNSPDAKTALTHTIKFFDSIGLDGQCPTNYTQCTHALRLQYGKVMLLNEWRVRDLLDFASIK